MNSNLLRPGFLALTVTQFFGAANDNILKGVLTFMVVDGAWEGLLGDGGQGIVGVCFTVPFILLSGYAGQLADCYSKSAVSKVVKFAELPIALIALLGFWTGNLWVTLLSLIALTCQSAFFGPAKYGMIPELVDSGDLSRANGSINMMTNIAVIVGTIAAGAISDLYYPQAAANQLLRGMTTTVSMSGLPSIASLPNTALIHATTTAQSVPAVINGGDSGLAWLPGLALVGVALAGIASVMYLGRLRAMGKPDTPFDWNPFTTYVAAIREMSKTRMLMVMMAWGYFYMLAVIALLIIPEYTKILLVPRLEASLLMGVLGVAVGVGCALAGLISGHHIEPRLIPLGALGMTVFFVLLALQPSRTLTGNILLSPEAGFILGAGISAGFYIIPLQALLQKLSPDDERGRFLGTANAVSFGFMTLSSLIYVMIAPLFQDAPQRMFLACATLMVVGAGFFLYRLRGTGIIFGNRQAPASTTTGQMES